MHTLVVPSVIGQSTQFSPGGGVLQLGQGLRMDGTSGDLTAGRIVSRAEGGGGTIRCSPAGETGESSIGFYRNGGGTIGTIPGNQWVIGQGSWNVGDRSFAIGANGLGSCLKINDENGTVHMTYGLSSSDVQMVPLINDNARIRFWRNSDKSEPINGDMWSCGLVGYGEQRSFTISHNNRSGSGGTILDRIVLDPTGVVRIPGSLQVGDVNVLTTPWVSCRITFDLFNNLSVSNHRGRHIPDRFKEDGAGRYRLEFPAHPSGANYVPQVSLHETTAQISTYSQAANQIKVLVAYAYSPDHSFNITIP
jgi:hypothetical protein